MRVSAAFLRKGTGDFLSWWFGELTALVPTPILRAVQPPDRTVAVTLDETHVTLTRHDGDSSAPIGRFPRASDDRSESRADLARVVAAYRSGRWRWGLYLDEAVVLRDMLRLPGAAIENYHEAVEFQIQRQTPFKTNEVYFDCRPLPQTDPANLIGVELIVARRDTVEAALKRLKAAGIPVDFVTAAFDRPAARHSFNLLPSGDAPHGRQPLRLNLALASIALLLAGLLVYLPMDRDRRTAAALSARVEQLRTEALVATRFHEQIETERRNMLSVKNRKQETRPFIRVLDDLTRLIPDEAWVRRLDYNDGTIRIVMHAPESGSIVRLIEGSDRFLNARMVTAVRQQSNTGQERFTLSFSARGGGSADVRR